MSTSFGVGQRVIAIKAGNDPSIGQAAESIWGYYGHVRAVTEDDRGHHTMWTFVEGRIGGRSCHPQILDHVWPFGDHELEHAD